MAAFLVDDESGRGDRSDNCVVLIFRGADLAFPVAARALSADTGVAVGQLGGKGDRWVRRGRRP
jgi:hypothetical protein